MTHLRKMMLEELERRNYAQTTIDCYVQTIEDFARHFRRPPDQQHECAGNQGFRCMLVGTQDDEIEIRLSRFPGKIQNST